MTQRISSRKRIVRIEDLKLSDIMQKVNPYFLRATQTYTAGEVVRYLIYAYLSSEGIALRKNKDFLERYSQKLNLLTLQFLNEFCPNDKIDWASLKQFNSGNLKQD